MDPKILFLKKCDIYKRLLDIDQNYKEIYHELFDLSETLRREYSLYGKPPFENLPIEEFQDYLMDGEPNPRSCELKKDARYIRYLKCKEILNNLSQEAHNLLQ